MRSGFADRVLRDYGHEERLFPSRLYRGIGYVAAFRKRAAYVGLRIRMGENARTKHTFDELHADRTNIEAELADVPHVRWVWNRHPHFTFSSINLVRDGAIHDPPDRLAETQAWMRDALRRLRAVLDPRLAAILEDLDAPDSA